MNALKLSIGLLLLFLGLSNHAQKTYNQIIKKEDGEKHLLGLSNRAGLEQAPFQEWFQENYTNYELDEAMLEKSKKKTKGVEVKVFMGTWCGDSKRGIPQFYKVMDEMGIKESNITLVNLDDSSGDYKQSPTGEEKGLNIHRVPTYIFYKKGEEIGRIVESPVTSYETDIAQILNEMPSSPNYKGVGQLHELLAKEDTSHWSQQNLVAHARKVYRSIKADRELNNYGYVLKARGELDKAIAVFEINRMIFPKVANVYDSLAEAYLENGNETAAKFYYEKVLELEEDNENALAQLEKMKEGEE
ncbi:MAG: thioredoxin family protein [Bacteroidota bacterium]